VSDVGVLLNNERKGERGKGERKKRRNRNKDIK
jgi:hypothetical protein